MDLADLTNRRFTVPETNTRRFEPTLAEKRKALKPKVDYSIRKRQRPVAGDVKQPTQNDPQH